MNRIFKTAMIGILSSVSLVNSQVVVPENPGFTPEQAAAMEAQARQVKWSQGVLSTPRALSLKRKHA